MKKNLPSLFANKIDKDINNNEKYFVSKNEEKNEERSVEKANVKRDNKNINQKIREIFTSTKYVYKIDVEITLSDKKIVKKVIGRNNYNLITMDNELIPINSIIDIRILE